MASYDNFEVSNTSQDPSDFVPEKGTTVVTAIAVLVFLSVIIIMVVGLGIKPGGFLIGMIGGVISLGIRALLRSSKG